MEKIITVEEELELTNDNIAEYKSLYQVKSETVEKLRDERAIIHYITAPIVDRTNDIIEPKGMDDKDFSKSPTVFFNHNYYYPIGKSLWRKKKDDGVIAKTQFSKTPFAEDIYKMHLEGVINTWSVGIIPRLHKGKIKDGAIVYDTDNNIRIFKDWILYEYSSAPLPANPEALDIMKGIVKSFEAKQLIDVAEIKTEILTQLQQYSKALEEINQIKSELEELKNIKQSVGVYGTMIETLNNEFNKISENIQKDLNKSVGTLDHSNIKTIIYNVVREVSRKK